MSLQLLDIDNPFNRAPVWYIDETESTMLLARNLIKQQTPYGTAVCAGFQTQGRGRLPGRKWLLRPGGGLLFTLILAADEIMTINSYVPDYGLSGHDVSGHDVSGHDVSGQDVSGQDVSGHDVQNYKDRKPSSLLAGLGVCYYLEKHWNLTPVIKWPNDVLLKNKKVSGILCERTGPYLLIGMGINFKDDAWPPDDKLALTATSIELEVKPIPPPKNKQHNPSDELSAVLAYLYQAWYDPHWKQQVTKRLWKLDKEIEVILGDPEQNEKITGVCKGIQPNGELMIEHKGGVIPIASAEILHE